MIRALASFTAILTVAGLLAAGCATPIEIPYADGGIAADKDRGGGRDSAVAPGSDLSAVPDMGATGMDAPIITHGDGGALGDASLGDASLGDASLGDASLGDAALGDAMPPGDATTDALGDAEAVDSSLGDAEPPLGDAAPADGSLGDAEPPLGDASS